MTTIQSLAAFLLIPNLLLLYGATVSFTGVPDPKEMKLPDSANPVTILIRTFALCTIAMDTVLCVNVILP